jgi:hypothetical protein
MLMFYLLYGDYEGGQRMITQLATRWGKDKWRLAAGRHFNVDRPEPRPLNGTPARSRALRERPRELCGEARSHVLASGRVVIVA